MRVLRAFGSWGSREFGTFDRSDVTVLVALALLWAGVAREWSPGIAHVSVAGVLLVIEVVLPLLERPPRAERPQKRGAS